MPLQSQSVFFEPIGFKIFEIHSDATDAINPDPNPDTTNDATLEEERSKLLGAHQ